MAEIEYIGTAPARLPIATYAGAHYERLVPDTLDLQDRAELAVNGLTGPTDPDADYEIYWILFPAMRPPVLQHDWLDACQAKYMETLPLMRLASGSQSNLHVERRWFERLLQMQGPDGLPYIPKRGRPWWTINHFGPPAPGDHYFTTYFGGRLLSAMTVQMLLTGDPVWRDAATQFVAGLRSLAIESQDEARFAWLQFGPAGAVPDGVDPQFTPGYGMASWTSPVIAALTQFHRATSDPGALELATKLANWIVQGSGYFGPDGSFLPEPRAKGADLEGVAGGDTMRHTYAHFHSHTITLMALLEVGLATSDSELLAFVDRGYRFGRLQGELTLGYFPEVIGRSSFEDAETCCVADMVSLALKLSAAGLGDHWDDADRWIRNQFIENQMTRDDWTWRFWESGPAHSRDFDLGRSAVDETYQTTDAAMQRSLGGFASHASANDFSSGRSGITACCTGNGARTLYHAWRNIISRDGDSVRVNLLLNRGSQWIDIDSHVPYEGRVTIGVKQACDLAVRMPQWVPPDADVSCALDGVARGFSWNGRYISLGRVEAGQTLALSFPIEERRERIYVQHRPFTLVLRGNEVVSIDPPGRYNPLYQRDHYRTSQVRWRKVRRFIPEQEIAW